LDFAFKIKSISDSILTEKEASQQQIDAAMWLAFGINAYRDITQQEVFDELEIIALTADDPLSAMTLTAINILYTGQNVMAAITPAVAGVTVQYKVTTSLGKTYRGVVKTDAGGRISFSVPAGECEETYTYTITTVLSGLTATASYMFYYE
jgi:hypothetical protein